MVSPLPELVSEQVAADHLRLVCNPGDYADVLLKVEHATGIVLDYLDRGDDDWAAVMVGWTTATVPRHVQAAVLLQLGWLYRFRGDDEATDELAPGVPAILRRLRDPVVS